jgi:hypothetical protein
MGTIIREPYIVYTELCNKIETMLLSPPTTEKVNEIDEIAKEMYESLGTINNDKQAIALCYDIDTNKILGFAALYNEDNGDIIMVICLPDTELEPFIWNPKYPGMLGTAPRQVVKNIMDIIFDSLDKKIKLDSN